MNWTDESVKMFTRVYSGNFNPYTPSIFESKNYQRLSLTEKIQRFKKDWTNYKKQSL